MEASTFDVRSPAGALSSSKSLGSIFRHFFEDEEIFKVLLGYYNQDNYRFEFKTIADRNNAPKILERNGFDYELVEDLRGYVVRLPRFAKYAQILKNSVASKETPTERIFLMKDLAAVEEAVGMGAGYSLLKLNYPGISGGGSGKPRKAINEMRSAICF